MFLKVNIAEKPRSSCDHQSFALLFLSRKEVQRTDSVSEEINNSCRLWRHKPISCKVDHVIIFVVHFVVSRLLTRRLEACWCLWGSVVERLHTFSLTEPHLITLKATVSELILTLYILPYTVLRIGTLVDRCLCSWHVVINKAFHRCLWGESFGCETEFMLAVDLKDPLKRSRCTEASLSGTVMSVFKWLMKLSEWIKTQTGSPPFDTSIIVWFGLRTKLSNISQRAYSR